MSISRSVPFPTDLFNGQTATASQFAIGALISFVLPVVCILLMCLLEDPWLAAASFMPAYGVFWLTIQELRFRGAGSDWASPSR